MNIYIHEFVGQALWFWLLHKTTEIQAPGLPCIYLGMMKDTMLCSLHICVDIFIAF